MTEHKCSSCDRMFKTQQGLLYHVANFVCKKMECKGCHKRFKSSKGLNYHLEHSDCGIRKKIIIIKKRNLTEFTLPIEEITLDLLLADGFEPKLANLIDTGDLRPFIACLFTTDNKDKYWSLYARNVREPYVYQYSPSSPHLLTRNMQEVVDILIKNMVRILMEWLARRSREQPNIKLTEEQTKMVAGLQRMANSTVNTREKKGVKHSLVSALVNNKTIIEDRFMKLGVKLK